METGLLCYIKDYSGNYYRADKSDQLVAAACESEATVFTFTQANDRIGTGKKAAFYCVVPIVERDREEQKSKTEQTEGEEIETEDEATHRLAVKDLILDELQNPPEKNVLSYDLSELDWTEYLTHFTYIVSGMKDYRDELAQQHSDIEQKICDILHYIELCETDESEAADFIELLRVCREKRRAVKDELMRLEYFQSNFGTSANVAGAKQALKSIKGLESRRYKPRKYNELFENCVMKDRQKKGAENYAPGAKQDREKQDITERVFGDDGSEEIMEEERYATPYDEKENDWLAFARQQAEFYRYSSQYIVNLQLDLREIEQEIEDILTEVETAHCNVAQGYKVFKSLKEMRLKKKAKTQELNCLYALTQCIDCAALAHVLEENLNEIEDIMNVEDDIDMAADTEKAQEMAG